ncbi:hypothetical protein N7493_000885 [Penicillium malachiteum]|uniref:Nucleoside phosphorylase domain-containing protein n=1 Tax=Penicillium malachiteum TaxID=1324776 RepID=A0AAD6N172_9EURO|nr:hypothetical protein N7493_000885 [Penicillium malachiteum]
MSQTEPSFISDEVPLFRQFTVGWITAIETEYLAARQILDVEYDSKKIRLPTGDTNVYTLGRVGEHNVVIATLPPNMYGTRSATAMANGLQRNFPMARVVLMVGVGGGAPAQRDVRLGDVVVGTRVVPYDFVKEHPNHTEFNGDILMSHSTLLNGTRKVQAAIMEDKLDLASVISARFGKTERIRDAFIRPNDASDRLYRPEYRHTDSCDCLNKRPRDLDMVLSRSDRKSYDKLQVHFGNIGSADKVIKDAIKRDKMTLEHQILCFEMESAGILPLFRCLLPIRGICDYSDSHKTKQWQGYAAACAAAYAKCLLDSIPPADLDTEIPPNADEMKSYISLVVQMVKQVTSTSSQFESGLEDVENAMKEIKESITMLMEMAKKNSDAIQQINTNQSKDSTALIDAQESVKKIEERQNEMHNTLAKMKEYIETQHAASPPENRSRWEDLYDEATKETSSLKKATEITEGASQAVKETAKVFKKVSQVTKSSDLEHVSSRLGTGGKILAIITNVGKMVSPPPSKSSKTPSRQPVSSNARTGGPGSSSRPKPPPIDEFPPPPTRCVTRRTPQAPALAHPPLPPRRPSDSRLAQQLSCDAGEDSRVEELNHNAAAQLSRGWINITGPERRPPLPERPQRPSTSTSQTLDDPRGRTSQSESAFLQQYRAAVANISRRHSPENMSTVSLNAPPLPPRSSSPTRESRSSTPRGRSCISPCPNNINVTRPQSSVSF